MSSKSGTTLIRRSFDKKKKDFKGFSIRWMAKQLDVSHVYLSHIVRGTRPIPIGIVDPLCEILDLDTETKSKIYHEVFKAKGYEPASTAQRKSLQKENNWNLVPLKDFDLLTRWENMAILLATTLDEYDGTESFIAKRLFLPIAFVRATMELLAKKDLLVLKDGKMVASEFFYEFQSHSSSAQIRKYHRSVQVKAIELMDKKTDAASVSRRLITSAAFTCSQDDLTRLKEKLVDFLKDFTEEATSSKSDDVYQLALQFFPVTDVK